VGAVIQVFRRDKLLPLCLDSERLYPIQNIDNNKATRCNDYTSNVVTSVSAINRCEHSQPTMQVILWRLQIVNWMGYSIASRFVVLLALLSSISGIFYSIRVHDNRSTLPTAYSAACSHQSAQQYLDS
jgi:hypothetical protein